MGIELAGLTLRDYFAAAAMQSVQMPYTAYEMDQIAKWAYAVADAMLEERAK